MSGSVLVTGASYALAYKLANILGENVILGESIDLSFNKQYPTIILPQLTDSSYSSKLLTICLDHGISSIYPLKRAEIALLNPVRTLFGEFDIELICPGAELMIAFPASAFNRNKEIILVRQGRVIRGNEPGVALSETLNGIFMYDAEKQGLELLIAE